MTRQNGAINAPVYAVQIIATADAELAQKLYADKEELAPSVAEKSEKVKREFQVWATRLVWHLRYSGVL